MPPRPMTRLTLNVLMRPSEPVTPDWVKKSRFTSDAGIATPNPCVTALSDKASSALPSAIQ